MALRSLFLVFRRRWPLFLLVFAAAVASSLLVLSSLTPVYTADAKIKIDPRQPGGLTAADSAGGAPDSALVDTEVSVMQSREVARAVVKRFDLQNDVEFQPELASGDASRLEGTVDVVLGQLGVRREGLTYIVDVSFSSLQPGKAARIANAFAEEYIASSREDRASAAEEQARTLSRQLRSLGAEVEAADAQIAQYRAATGTLSGGANFGTVNDQQINTIAAQLAVAQSEAAAARAEARAASTQSGRNSIDAVSQVLQSPAINELRAQRANVLRERAEIDSRYGPRHPSAIRAREQLAQLDAELVRESRRIVSGVQSTATAREAHVRSLQAELARLRGQQSSNARSSVEAEALQRDADAKRAIYNDLNRAAQQASQQVEVGQVQARIISRASPPNDSSFPQTTLFAAFGLMLGGVLALAAVLLAEALDNGVRTAADVEGLGVSFVGATPALPGGPFRARPDAWTYVADEPRSPFSEALRGVRNALLLQAPGGGPKVVTVTSAAVDPDKTSVVMGLARVIAMTEERVLLVDCDLQGRTLSRCFKQPPELGLVEVLSGRCAFDEAVKADELSGLHVLPLAASADSAPDDLFSRRAMVSFLEAARASYDRILLDAPPALGVTDARVLTAASDGALVLMRAGKTSRVVAGAALSSLRGTGGAKLGVVLTRADPAGVLTR